MKFGDKLIQLRKKNGLSQEELAAKLNVSRQTIYKWETNLAIPRADHIVAIVKLFDISKQLYLSDEHGNIIETKTDENIVSDRRNDGRRQNGRFADP
mgnify:CR=1 FL=1